MLVTLCMGPGPALYALNHPDPKLTIVAFCKVRFYINQSSSMMYRWCLTAACFDRFALSSANARLRKFANINIARRVVLVIMIAWLVLPVHTLIFYDIRNGSCAIFYNVAVALYHSLFTTILGCILPVSIMTTCALLIRRNLVLKRRRRLQNANQSERTSEIHSVQRKRDHQVLLMLLIQVIVYVTLITPLMAFYFYNAVSLYIPNKTAERVAIENFAGFIGETLVFLFSVLSFYLYTMVSRSFRDEFIKLLLLVVTYKWYGNSNRIGSITSDIPNRRITANQLVKTIGLKTLVTDHNMSIHPIEQQQTNND